LANGLEIIAECNPDAVSAAVGFFVRTGARDEPTELAGVSHFLEHMAFKGSERRCGDDVNRAFDEIGAKYNAYTTEEQTVYHAAVLPEYLPAAADLLADLLQPALRASDFETERQVILEEIGMYEDSPMWSAYERTMRLHFGDHPLGNCVLGSAKSVGPMTAEQMRTYHAQWYSPSNIVVVGAGRLDWREFRRLVDEICGHWKARPVQRVLRDVGRRPASEVLKRGQFVQECIFVAANGPPADSPFRMAAEVLASVIGDETGSRFYWSLIEPGKIESAEFNLNPYQDAGVFLGSIGCSPSLADENLATVRRILAEVTSEGITAAELEQAKNKLGSRIVLAAERPQNRLFAVGYHWLYRRRFRSVEDDLAELQAVTLPQIRELLHLYPLNDLTLVCLGPLEHIDGVS
jgi:predicted Zn-dependent peptidase